MAKPTTYAPDPRIKLVIIGATTMAFLMLLCGVLLLIAGSWAAGLLITFLSLIALSYDIYAAVQYRRRRRDWPHRPDRNAPDTPSA